MEIADLLTPELVIAKLRATSKKQALQELARRAAEITGQSERAIFSTLTKRERLGTTGVGNGIAIPHGKLASLDRLHGMFARLEHAIDFDAIDDRPVDLIFLLLAPEFLRSRSPEGAGACLAPFARQDRLRQTAWNGRCRSSLCASRRYYGELGSVKPHRRSEPPVGMITGSWHRAARAAGNWCGRGAR